MKRVMAILVVAGLCAGTTAGERAAVTTAPAATLPTQTKFYLMGDRIFANPEAAEKWHEAEAFPWGGDTATRAQCVALYERVIALQPGAMMNAEIAARIASTYAFAPDAARGADDPEMAAVWWKKCRDWAEPGTRLAYEATLEVGMAGEQRDDMAFYMKFLEMDENKVLWPGWQYIRGSIEEPRREEWLISMPEPEASPGYAERIQQAREEARQVKLKAARQMDRILESRRTGHPRESNRWMRGELKALAERYQCTAAGEYFDKRWRECGGENGWDGSN